MINRRRFLSGISVSLLAPRRAAASEGYTVPHDPWLSVIGKSEGVDRSDIQETLVSLYLRLNGYFVSGFIVHAVYGVETELDVLAVRFPRHEETPFGRVLKLNRERGTEAEPESGRNPEPKQWTW